MLRVTGTVIASIISMPMLSAPSLAVDFKVMPGMACQAYTGPATTGFTGTIASSSVTSASIVLCPIVLDDPTSKPVSVTVTVVDRSSVGNITCGLHAAMADGKTTRAGATLSSSGSSGASQTLNLPIPDHFSGGYYYINCTLPRRATGDSGGQHVASYRWGEVSGGN